MGIPAKNPNVKPIAPKQGAGAAKNGGSGTVAKTNPLPQSKPLKVGQKPEM